MEPTHTATPQPDEVLARAANRTWLQPFSHIHEPRRVAVLLASPCGGAIATGWLIADDDDSILERRFAQHFMDECSGVEAALGRAAEELIENWLADGTKTYVYTDNPTVQSVLRTLRQYLPNLLVLDSPGPRTTRLTHALRLELRDYRNEISATLDPTVIATDASVQLGRTGIGVGAITADGRHFATYHEDSADILVGELLAIRDALKYFPDPVIKILSDNKKAVALVRDAIDPQINLPTLHRKTAVIKALRDIRNYASEKQLHIEWVRAHAGHTLNEGADRLAVAVRRAARSKLSAAELAVIFEQIVEDIVPNRAQK